MNGKGDTPRNNYSEQFRDNYDMIDWSRKPKLDTTDVSCEDCKSRDTNQSISETNQE